MRRNWGLSELLARVFERSTVPQVNSDKRSIESLCKALLSEEGEVSGYRLAATILAQYRSMDESGRRSFFSYLNTQLDVDTTRISELATAYERDRTSDNFEALLVAAEPRRQELLRRLNQTSGATRALVKMRVDLLKSMQSDPDLRRTDLDFIHLLRSWFNRGFLVLQQINWSTPATILDKIVAYEAVHQIAGLDDLRHRLAPPDRKCFAFFHPSMPDEPLIFVEVALGADIPGSVSALLSDNRTPIEAEAATTATFYSISNCQAGLAGISFGNLLIKQVVAELSIALPQLQTFVTLSPIPGLVRWLKSRVDDPQLGQVVQAVLEGTASEQDTRKVTARYLLSAKREDGKPVDPVARFHLGNGAELHDIHVKADNSQNGIKQSRGVMVNYLYDLQRIEKNHEDFVLRAKIAASKTVRAAATADVDTSGKGNAA